jgi:VWFA-related protein
MKESLVRPVAWFLTLVWATAWGFAQTGPGAGLPEQQVLRVTTRLVVVNVVVHDKKGAPVAGLTRDDFMVFDGGKEEKISVFAVESGRGAQGPLEPLAANVFSNRMAKRGGIPASVAVILLDAIETKFEDAAFARQQLIKFLGQLQPQDRVALYVLGERVSVIQDFTDDPAPLLEAIQRYSGPTEPAPRSPVQDQALAGGSLGLSRSAALAAERLDAGLHAFAYVSPRVSTLAHARLKIVLNAFEDISRRLSGLPGHKALIWVTGDIYVPGYFPHLFDGDVSLFCTYWPGLSREIMQTARAVKEADLAVYPVNARGLVTNPDYEATRRIPASPVFGIPSSPDKTLWVTNLVDLGMHHIAQETGGRAFYNTNDLKGALRTALDDSEITYTLGYYPSHGQWDGRYRSIKVRVNIPGVEVRHRQGYFASPVPAGSVGTKDRMAMLKEAALNPLEATGVGVTVKLTPFTGPTGAHKLEIDISPDLSDLTFQQVNGRWTGLFDVLAGQYSKQGKSLRGTTKTLSENMTNATYQEVMRKGLTITFYQDVAPRAEELRVVVRDGLSGSTGTVKIPLHQ